MIPTTRFCAAVTTLLLAAPALAQPGAQPEPFIEPPPVNAGTVVIVTPQQPIVGAPVQGAVPAPPAPPAPQNQPWSNVSHINGQVVKVGEQGEYLYNNGKTINLASNPIGWMFGFYGASVSIALGKNIALRGDLNVYDLDDSHSGSEIGVSVPIYFRRTFSGPFLEPGVVSRNLDGCDGCGSAGPEVMFGWHWMFDSGLNVAMAFGALRDMTHGSGGSDSAEPTGYFRVGYAF